MDAGEGSSLRPSKAENVPVARLVPEGDGLGFVHFADGDRLNRRCKNLSVQPHRVLKARPNGAGGRAEEEAFGRVQTFSEAPAPLPAETTFILPDRPPIPEVKRGDRSEGKSRSAGSVRGSVLSTKLHAQGHSDR